jgi:NADPH:quinone reductase-like Zn-dependent oxidoreductase
MKAIVYDRYGSFDDLEMRDIAKPVIEADEVLVRIRAAALHVGDCFAVRGSPFVMRLAIGLLKPKHGIPGFDGAGEVEAVGAAVRHFRPSDAVFGQCDRACAEYAAVNQDKLALKPANLTFEQAAALSTSALAALHALRDVGKVRPGQEVLINGASGGVGTFAVQIAKSFGANVTGVCNTRNVEMVRSLGADHVIDYTTEDFTSGASRCDVIFDNVENRSLSDCRRALTPSGTLILNSGTRCAGHRHAGSAAEAARVVTVRATEASAISLGRKPQGSGCSEGAHRVRAAHACHRSDAPAARNRGRPPLHRSRTCPGKGRHHYLTRGHAGMAALWNFSAMRGGMTEAGLAVFVLVGFLLPVPILTWLDRSVTRRQGR